MKNLEEMALEILLKLIESNGLNACMSYPKIAVELAKSLKKEVQK